MVQLREDAREFTLVDIGTILGLAHLIPEGDRPWLVNSSIDLTRFISYTNGGMMDMCECLYRVPWQAVYIVCTSMKKLYN